MVITVDKGFVAARARAWDALPDYFTRPPGYFASFRALMKTYPFPGLSDTDNMRRTDFVTWS